MHTQQPMNRPGLRRGFTIVELVIIIAVLSILVAILVPTFSGVAETARQNALRMNLGNAYTSFKADCGFRDEVCLEMGAYIFVPESAIDRDGDSLSANKLIFVSEGYQWTGDDKANAQTVTASRLGTLYDTKAVMYGPFNGYYLMGLNQAYLWEGDGTQASPYLIKSYRDLRAISEHVSRGETFLGKYFLLTTDLNIAQSAWLPIGGFLSPTQEAGLDSQKAFRGDFDGGSHTITLGYGRVERARYCLFGHINGATIHDLKTTGSLDIGSYAAGIVAVAENSTIYNCESSVSVAGDMNVGGIVAYSFQSTIRNCVNTGNVTSYEMGTIGNFVGGIAGETGKSTIENCRNEGDIIGHAGVVGGIVGNAWGTIRNCVNAGSVTAKYTADVTGAGTGSKDALAGGIAGYGGREFSVGDGEAIIDGCLNTGAVTGGGRAVGGIIGANPKSVTNCANTGAVTARGYVGGIVGVVNKAGTTIANVMNSGTINARGEEAGGNYTGPVGGIIGHLAFSDAFTLTLAVSGGQVQFRKDASVTAYNDLGMFVGSAGGKVTLKNTYLAISAGATIGTNTGVVQNMGKSITVSGTPTTQTNQNSLLTAINGVISSSYAGKGYHSWALKTGYLNGVALPTSTFAITLNINNGLPAGHQVGLVLNTGFVGASVVYLPTPDRTIVVDGGWQYTFKHWTIGSANYACGDQYNLTGDVTATAVWEKQPYTMTPIPFG